MPTLRQRRIFDGIKPGTSQSSLLLTDSAHMATATSEIRAFTAAAFRTPQKFTDFCRNAGTPLGGVIDGEQSAGSMNATFQTIDPGSQEVLATVCEMGEAEVAMAVEAAERAFRGNGGTGWRNLDVEDRIELVNRLVEL